MTGRGCREADSTLAGEISGRYCTKPGSETERLNECPREEARTGEVKMKFCDVRRESGILL